MIIHYVFETIMINDLSSSVFINSTDVYVLLKYFIFKISFCIIAKSIKL